MAKPTPKQSKKRGARTGFTTGACSAAAARAAAIGLMTGRVPEQVETLLPNGERITFNVIEGYCRDNQAHAVVVKDAGDDPDVTDKAHLTADLRVVPDHCEQILFVGGEGVGHVTQPGLGLEIDGPAINPVPQQNIRQNITEVAASILESSGIEVTLSVPGGAEMAQRTLNPRLGIIGGISILGTSGIVHPWSTAAFRACVEQGIEVAARQGQQSIVLTTGGRTEKFVMREHSELPDACFVQMGDFLKPAFDTLVAQQIPHVIIGGMVGKLTKMAQGETITHANRNPVNMSLVAEIAASVGADNNLCEAITQAKTARFALEQLSEIGLQQPFLEALGRSVITTLKARYPGKFTLQVLICDFEGNKLAEVSDAE
ncbi:MAG: cobalt-precorrin-5B (C(1))-methyltransferase [Candidatus Polarisedimenticolaceae bacterium]|nr:cobalt-precorrin-5B (C(1))-methyltransferase [Candidatus Polarisedimenticolaceae bacterium]